MGWEVGEGGQRHCLQGPSHCCGRKGSGGGERSIQVEALVTSRQVPATPAKPSLLAPEVGGGPGALGAAESPSCPTPS